MCLRLLGLPVARCSKQGAGHLCACLAMTPGQVTSTKCLLFLTCAGHGAIHLLGATGLSLGKHSERSIKG